MDLDFKKNLNDRHRLVRLSIGILLLVLAYTRLLPGWWAILAIVFGVSQVIEAALSY